MEPTLLVYGIGGCCNVGELQSDVGVNEVAKGMSRTRFLYGNSNMTVTIRTQTQTRKCTRVCFPANLRDVCTRECSNINPIQYVVARGPSLKTPKATERQGTFGLSV